MMINTNVVSREAVENAKDEIIRTLNYINSSGRLDYEDYCELFDTINREFLVLLKQSRKEMSAREYLKARERLCYEQLSNNSCCSGCLMLQCKGCDCETIESNRPDDAVAIVKKWAKEHPEEVKDEID